MKDSRPFPAVLLVLGQLPQLGHDLLSRPPLGSSRLDQGEIGVPFAVLGASILTQEHPCLHSECDTDSGPGKEVGPHYIGFREADYAWRYREHGLTLEIRPKIASISSKLRNPG